VPKSAVDFLREMLDLLIREERRGQRFFAEAARFVSSSPARLLLETLAVEESYHLAVLEQEKRKVVAEGEGKEQPPQLLRQTIEYAGEELNIYTLDLPEQEDAPLPRFELFKPEDFQALLADATLPNILKLGMRLEVENFKFLVEVARQVQSEFTRKVLLGLANQEKQHFLWLRHRYDNLGR